MTVLPQHAPYHILDAGIPVGENQVLRYVSVDEINVDESYQRGLINAHVDKIYREFNPELVGVVNLGKRANGKLYNKDGNHRVTAIKMRLKDGLPAPDKILCLITLNSTAAIEANDFVRLNTVKPVTGNAKFRARLCSNDNPECAIRNCLEKYGFVIDFLPGGFQNNQNRSINGVRGPAKLLEAWSKCNSVFEEAVAFFKTALSDENGFVPYEYRKGEIIYSLCLMLQTQGIKDGKKLGKEFKDKKIDFSVIVDNAKRDCDNRWGMFKAIAKSLAASMCLRVTS